MVETLEHLAISVEGLVSVEVRDTQFWVTAVLCLEQDPQLYVTSNVCGYIS